MSSQKSAQSGPVYVLQSYEDLQVYNRLQSL